MQTPAVQRGTQAFTGMALDARLPCAMSQRIGECPGATKRGRTFAALVQPILIAEFPYGEKNARFEYPEGVPQC